MSTTVSDLLVERLGAWGIKRIFGYPGDGINGVIGAIQRAGDRFEFIQPRHEEMAAFMAVGHAKFTGEIGVCMSTGGPGAIHLLNGLYDAALDHQPVLAIVGQTALTAMGGSYLQEVDLHTLFKDVCSEFVHTVTAPEQIPGVVDRAVRTALSQRRPTCLIVPADVQHEKAKAIPPHAYQMVPGSLGYAAPSLTPPASEIGRAAQVLNDGERVAILVGQGARSAADDVMRVADVLGAGVAKALLGKDVLDDNLPYVTGSIGMLGTRPSYELMMDCDTLLMIGSSFPYSQFLPDWGDARGVQIDIDARQVGLRYPMEVNLVGDASSTLQALLPLLERKTDRTWQQHITEQIEHWWRVIETRAMDEADPLNPARVFFELSGKLPDDCIITVDSGTAAPLYARNLKLRRGMRASVSGTLASMGCGVPYAIAAKFAHPDRPVIALVGDGAMQMNGMAELLTVKRYWERWSDPRLIVLVLNNGDLNFVTWEMRNEGMPRFADSQDLPAFSYACFAEQIGFESIVMDDPDTVAAGWDRALAARRPVVIDAIVDPTVPPLPPHIELETAKSMMMAILRGDPDARDIVKQAFRSKLAEILPNR